MATRTSFSLKGFESYLENVVQAEIDVDQAVAEALVEGGDVILAEMEVKVPKDTRNLERHLTRTIPQREGNFTFVDVGMEQGADAETARYGNAQEYGYQRGGKFYAPQSYIRVGFDKAKARARRAMREVLKSKGFVD